MKTIGAACVLLLVTSPSIAAQSAPGGPRAGAWGAQASIGAAGPDLGGAILRFRNDRAAWLFGLDGSFSQREAVFHTAFGDSFTRDIRTVTAGARVGYRAFRSPGSATRPIIGGGILGSILQVTDAQHGWGAGVYGELGISRFFGPSFSVGTTAELQARRLEVRIGERRSPETRIGFNAVRLAAMVIF